MRFLTPFATLAAVFALGNALAEHDWLTAASAGVLVVVGILFLAPPAAVAAPAPRPAATEAGQQGAGR